MPLWASLPLPLPLPQGAFQADCSLLHLDQQPCHQNASVGLAFGGRPDLHGQLMGWALDGFGIYSYQVNHDDYDDDTYILQRTLVERHQRLMSAEATLVLLTQGR